MLMLAAISFCDFQVAIFRKDTNNYSVFISCLSDILAICLYPAQCHFSDFTLLRTFSDWHKP